MTRLRLLWALWRMPDEAFGWLVLALPPKAMMRGATCQVWPDGIGGFAHRSRQSIENVRDLADVYIAEKSR